MSRVTIRLHMVLLTNESVNLLVVWLTVNLLATVVVTVNRKLMTLDVLPNNDLFPSMFNRCRSSDVLPFSESIVIVLAGFSVVLSVSVVVSAMDG